MSVSKKSRFEGLPLRTSSTNAPQQAAINPEPEEVREALSTQIRSDLKIALKQASAQEQRKLYQVLEDSLEDYLQRHHPGLLK